MAVADWGNDEKPGFFGVRLMRRNPVYSNRAEDVPEVAAALEHGYFPAPEGGVWCFLPAIWPREARTWVRDQRVRLVSRSCGDGPSEWVPRTAADYADIENSERDTLAELGLPTGPAGRIWLLRPPPGYPSLEDFTGEVWDSWRASGGPAMLTREFVAYTETRIGKIV